MKKRHTYKIIKESRTYNGSGYDGPTCEFAGIPKDKTYHDIKIAKRDAEKLLRFNPVGFVVVDAVTGTRIKEA